MYSAVAHITGRAIRSSKLFAACLESCIEALFGSPCFILSVYKRRKRYLGIALWIATKNINVFTSFTTKVPSKHLMRLYAVLKNGEDNFQVLTDPGSSIVSLRGWSPEQVVTTIKTAPD